MNSDSLESRPGMGDLTFRTPTVDDARAVAEFQTVCWREAYVGVVPQAYLDSVGVDERQRRWADRILGSEREVLVVEDEGGIVAVASWGDDTHGRELKSLYVRADHRGSGLADILMARSVGEDPAHLWVFRDNPRAHAFYARHGFVATGAQIDDPDTGLTIVQLRRGPRIVGPAA